MHSNKTLQLLAADQVLFHVEGKPDQAADQPFLQKSCLSKLQLNNREKSLNRSDI